MSADCRLLKRLSANLEIIIPLQTSMTVSLPVSSKNYASHIPFPNQLPTITGFVEEIEVLNSLQRPRKISMIGSDGNCYIFVKIYDSSYASLRMT
jgi:serine/threonine-protein kinase ATR